LHTNERPQVAFIGILLVSLAIHILASPVATELVTADDLVLTGFVEYPPEDWPGFNDTDIPTFYDEYFEDENSTEYKELEARQSNEWVDCGQNILISVYKAGFRTMLDSIPDVQINIVERPLYSFGASYGDLHIRAFIRRTQGTVASGSNIRRMGHRGWNDCVATGRNDNIRDRSRFHNYRVENPGYVVDFGGGGNGCRNGHGCYNLPNPS
jgi:hypothetical protein